MKTVIDKTDANKWKDEVLTITDFANELQDICEDGVIIESRAVDSHQEAKNIGEFLELTKFSMMRLIRYIKEVRDERS